MSTDDKTAEASSPDDDHETNNVPAILAAPLHLSSALISKGTAYIRPIAPQLISFSVCLLLVPPIVFLSFFSGWFVWKNVAVGWEVPVYLQYGDGLQPYAEIQLPSLVAQQPYDVSLFLIIPAIESNFALGNFMTTLTLTTPSNRTLTSVRRPSITSPASSSFWSGRPSIVHITVPLLLSFVPGTSHIVAKLEVGRRDGWKSLAEGHGRELSVLSASLRGVIKLQGLRGLITRFPIFSALISSIIFLIISLIILTAFFLPALQWTSSPGSDSWRHAQVLQTERHKGKRRAQAGLSDDSEDYDDDGEEKPWRSRPKARINTGISAHEGSSTRTRAPPATSGADVKTEAPSTVIPQVSADSGIPVRRRRSRLFQNQSDENS